MGDIVLTSVIVLLPAKRSPGPLSREDMILSTETVIVGRSNFREHIRIGNNSDGILASQTTALLTRISAIS
jgi:hypothetical protein